MESLLLVFCFFGQHCHPPGPRMQKRGRSAAAQLVVDFLIVVIAQALIAGGIAAKLRMAPYSQKLFSSSNILADDDYLIKADIDDYCFVEREDVKPYEDKIQKVIVFRWNRHYPSDLKFGIDLSTWHLVASEEFPGSSHLKIAMEVYER